MEERDSVVIAALSMRLGQPWEVNDPEHRVITKGIYIWL